MKIFLDTANLDDITAWMPSGIIDGVTTNPTHLSAQGGDPRKQVLAICAAVPEGDVSVEVTESDPEKVYIQAKAIAALAENVVVKIPCHQNYYAVIKRLADEGVALNITLVFSVIQGLMMAKLDVKYISPFVGRWDDIDAQGVDVLLEMREMMDTYHFSTQILAASLRSVRHLHHAIAAGADVATVSRAVLEKATSHVLTDKGMAKFDADWQKLGIKQFP